MKHHPQLATTKREDALKEKLVQVFSQVKKRPRRSLRIFKPYIAPKK